MAWSVLDDKSRMPDDERLADVLGKSKGLWDAILAHLAEQYPGVQSEWGFPGAKYGWSLRPKDTTTLVGRRLLRWLSLSRAILMRCGRLRSDGVATGTKIFVPRLPPAFLNIFWRMISTESSRVWRLLPRRADALRIRFAFAGHSTRRKSRRTPDALTGSSARAGWWSNWGGSPKGPASCLPWFPFSAGENRVETLLDSQAASR